MPFAHLSNLEQYTLPFQTLLDQGFKKIAFPGQKQLTFDAIVPGDNLYRDKMVPSTQKAIGIGQLSGSFAHLTNKNWNFLTAYLIHNDFDMDIVEKYWKVIKSYYLAGAMFARPCPKTPRHGFVDSISVKSPEELRVLWTKSREADPEAEIVLMPFINADFNMVISPSLTSIGPGTDGATSGVGAVSAPISVMLPPKVVKAAGITPSDSPYVEAVIKGGMNYVVQLRGGPKVEDTRPDFCPFDGYKITEVVQAKGDLLQWEEWAEVAGAKIHNNLTYGIVKHQGLVVDHVGGSMLSHYAVHCRLNGVPIITSHHPEVGEVLSCTTNVVEQYDPELVLEGMRRGFAVMNHTHANHNIRSQLLSYACGVLQNVPDMVGGHSVHLGAGAAIIYSLGMAAAYGEARHCDSGHTIKGETLQHLLGVGQKLDIYDHVFSNLPDTRPGLGEVFRVFWSGPEDTGYGGKKWGRCTKSIINLDLAMLRLLKNPNDKTAKGVAGAANQVLQMAHNGGWWLNKFGMVSTFNAAASGGLSIPLAAGPIIFMVGSEKSLPSTAFKGSWPWDNGISPIKLAMSPAEKKAKKEVEEKQLAHAKAIAEAYQKTQAAALKEAVIKKANWEVLQKHPEYNSLFPISTVNITKLQATKVAVAFVDDEKKVVIVRFKSTNTTLLSKPVVKIPFKSLLPFVVDWIRDHTGENGHQLAMTSSTDYVGYYVQCTSPGGVFILKISKEGMDQPKITKKVTTSNVESIAIEATPSGVFKAVEKNVREESSVSAFGS